MQSLYPEIKPYRSHQLAVDPPHVLHVEESGNPGGIPVLFVHGGPGSGTDHKSHCYFNPEVYRIIVFDQRGAGQSTPHACLENNTTADLLADMEAIRSSLNVDQWLLFGGSWGSTLSLLYAQLHPQRVLGMVLRGIFLCREKDLHWFYRDGASRVFADHWQDFIAAIPDSDEDDAIAAYHRVLTSDNELARMSAAKSWCQWEARCATLHPQPEIVNHITETHNALAMARLETHYFINQSFIRPNQILDDIDRLHGIPATLVHGRYDMVCPLENALALHRAWPGSELNILRDAGHAASEPSIVDALVRATDDMAERLMPQ